MKVLVPMAGVIDADAEIARLTKQRGKIEADLAKSAKKLANPAFVDNAPAEVVEKERARAAEMEAALQRLEEQLERVRAIT